MVLQAFERTATAADSLLELLEEKLSVVELARCVPNSSALHQLLEGTQVKPWLLRVCLNLLVSILIEFTLMFNNFSECNVLILLENYKLCNL